MSYKIYIVDTFTKHPFKGNPAGVCIGEDFPESMQAVAAEINLSETAFVKPLQENTFHIRWMTPITEVTLCGHGTLAAAHVLFSQGHINSPLIVFESLMGLLSVEKQGDTYILDLPLQRVSGRLSTRLVASVFDPSMIIEVVKAKDDIIICLQKEDFVYNYLPDFEALKQLDARAVIITALSKKYDFVSRFFNPKAGINEDPVTGSAHCKLADYWSTILGKSQLKAYQASCRGGEMIIETQQDRVKMKGHAVTVLKGELTV